MPASQPKAKTIWIISASLLVILLAGGAWFFFQSKAQAEAEARARQENLKQAETTARNFLEALVAKDLEKASSYFQMSEAERQKAIAENKNKSDFQQANIKLESVGPAAYAPDNENRILVPVTVSLDHQKKTQKLPLEYNADRQCWLIVPDR